MYEVVGYEIVDYISKNGNRVEGCKLHLCYERKEIEGVGVCTEYISKIVPYSPSVGQHLDFLYDKYGKVKRVDILE